MTRAAAAIEIAREAMEQGHIPYKLGAKCPAGWTLLDCAREYHPLDCSGFIRQLAKEAGAALPDGSQAQKAACRTITLATALGATGAGRLLFMSPKLGGKNWPRHVALSLSNGLSLECASGGRDAHGTRISGVGIYRRTTWTSAGSCDALLREAA